MSNNFRECLLFFVCNFLLVFGCFAKESSNAINESVSSQVVLTKIAGSKMFVYSDQNVSELTQPFVEELVETSPLTFFKSDESKTNMINVTLAAQIDKESYPESSRKLEIFLAGIDQIARGKTKIDFEVTSSKHYFIVNQDVDGFLSENRSLTSNANQSYDDRSFENIFIFDWQMADHTIGGAIFHDDLSGDRFIFKIHPSESRGVLKICPKKNLYFGLNQPHNVSPIPWTFFSPVDLYGAKAVGSWKGKFMATVSKGFVKDSQVEQVENQTRYIPVNQLQTTDDIHLREYTNGMSLRRLEGERYELTDDLRVKDLMSVENLSVLDLDLDSYATIGAEISEQLGIRKRLVKVFRLIKRDSGFSRLDELPINHFSDAVVVMINRSSFPDNYGYFNLAQDLSFSGLPIIQMYQFNPGFALKASITQVKNLLLSPTDEVFYRKSQGIAFPEQQELPRLHTEVDLIIYE